MKLEIKHRWSGRVLFEGEADSILALLKLAVSQGISLRGADLRGADLRGADLSDAVLRGADLSDAVLRGADLSGADFSDADLRGADLRGAVLRGAVLRGADLSGAVLRGLAGIPEIPIVQDLDAKIFAAIGTDGGGKLDMAHWHSCETTHCRAGWAIHLAGEKGYALERALGSYGAGALIYQESAGYVPNFYASNSDALEDMRSRVSPGPAAEAPAV